MNFLQLTCFECSVEVIANFLQKPFLNFLQRVLFEFLAEAIFESSAQAHLGFPAEVFEPPPVEFAFLVACHRIAIGAAAGPAAGAARRERDPLGGADLPIQRHLLFHDVRLSHHGSREVWANPELEKVVVL